MTQTAPMLDPRRIRAAVVAALEEDLGAGDLTTSRVVPEDVMAAGALVARQPLVVAGLDAAALAFRHLDPDFRWEGVLADGLDAKSGTVLARVKGRARALISAERVVLNFLGRLSGVATLTRRYVEAVTGTRARVRGTRVSTPGLRFLESHAIELGGGVAALDGLDAGLCVGPGHMLAAGGTAMAVKAAVAGAGGRDVLAAPRRFEEIPEALAAGAAVLLLPPLTVVQVRDALALVAGRATVEAAAADPEEARALAEAGVDVVRVAALTAAAPHAEVALELEVDA